MKSKLLVIIAFIGILLFVAACSPSTESDAADLDQVEEEHADDEHSVEDEDEHAPEDHMAGAHNVPEEASAVPNPFLANDDSRATGEKIFSTSCAVCHGEKGLGDGPTAEALENKPADLTEGHVQELSDGALFYIISHGKPETPMPAWEDILEEEDRWNVVNFMRTLVGEHEEGDDHTEDEHMEDDEHMDGDDHAEDEHSD
jgi:mono/diheme cytochrome c family protein